MLVDGQLAAFNYHEYQKITDQLVDSLPESGTRSDGGALPRVVPAVIFEHATS